MNISNYRMKPLNLKDLKKVASPTSSSQGLSSKNQNSVI
jgi:hypothetical protein